LPKVSVIVPCKGLDPGFEENILAILTQNYPDYEMIFVTSSKDDLAYPVLEKIIKNNLKGLAKLLTSGIASCRSQKLTNHLKALREVNKDSEVLIFLDSDIRPKPDFLRDLIAPLKDAKIGIATGFRWYQPSRANFASLLRSAWNAGGLVFVTDKCSNYAWGGAMAIKKEVFRETKIAKVWENSLSDDLSISSAIRKAGYQIKFVPQCLAVSYENCSFAQLWEWSCRQTIISKVYHPALWRSIFIAHGISNTVLGLVFILLTAFLLGLITSKVILLASLLMLAIVPMEMLNGLILLSAVEQILPEHKDIIRKRCWRYIAAAPLASFLALGNTIYSLFTNRIAWRGITYELRSPVKTKIISQNTDR